jgi:hypothetical protein
LLRGHLTRSKVIVSEDGMIQMVDFCKSRFMELEGKSGEMIGIGAVLPEGWMPTTNVRACAEALSKIRMGGSEVDSMNHPAVPEYLQQRRDPAMYERY